MFQLNITDETRRVIGNRLLAVDCEPLPVSAISAAVGVSRVTLAKWKHDPFRLWWLTKHIPDETLATYCGVSYYGSESAYHDHAQGYRERVREIRAAAAAGKLGKDLQLLERERMAEVERAAEGDTPQDAHKRP